MKKWIEESIKYIKVNFVFSEVKMFKNLLSGLKTLNFPYSKSLAPEIQVRWRWHKDNFDNK